MKNLYMLLFALTLLLSGHIYAQTSWTGERNANWNVAGNWTQGVPDETIDAIVGDENFTGTRQPTIRQNTSLKSLHIGEGAQPVEITIRRNITLTEDLVIGANGTVIQENNSSILLEGNWVNAGTYTGEGARSQVIFSGASQELTGPTAFRLLTINAGTTLNLNDNISIGNEITINGTLNPGPDRQVTGNGNLTVNADGTLLVMAADFISNYNLGGTITLGEMSIVDYASSSLAQTISNTLTYCHLRISGGTTKTPEGNLPPLESDHSNHGRIIVAEGILDLNGFTANRGNATIGGSFIVAGGASLKIGGTHSFPANFNEFNLAVTSNVIYNGGHQTVSGLSYGNLTLSSSEAVAEKTSEATALIVAGDLTMNKGEGTGVLFTASENITVNRSVVLGASCSFDGGEFTHTFRGNWNNQGSFTGNTSTVIFSGLNATLSGAGENNFHDLQFASTGISADAVTSINISGNLLTTDNGSFTHSPGGSLVMEGTNKSITGKAIELYNLTINQSTTTTAHLEINGDFVANSSFSASEGSVTFSGDAKTISGTGPISFFALNISGNISAPTNFSILSNLLVSADATFEAPSGTATFQGTSSLSGTANLFNVVIDPEKTLRLGANAVLGIGNTFTPDGIFDVSTTTPNTVNYYSPEAQWIAATTYNNLTLSNAGAKTATGSLIVKRDFTIKEGGSFHASGYTHHLNRHLFNHGAIEASTSTFELGGASTAHLHGETQFHNLVVNKSESSASIILLGDISTKSLAMDSGSMQTGNHSVTITQDRTGNGIIIGTIIRNHSFSHGIAYHFEGPQNAITFSGPDEQLNSVTVSVAIEEILDFIPGKEAVTREYQISIPQGTYTDATLRLHYENNELNAFMENHLAFYRHVSENNWDSVGVTSRNPDLNFVEKTGMTTGIEGRWAMSGIRNIVRWNGLVSTQWEDPDNWTTVSGEDMTDRVPEPTDAVQIGYSTFPYQPIINSEVTVNALQFGSEQTCTLTLQNSLTLLGSLRGYWPDTQTHVVEVGNDTLDMGTNLILSDGKTGNGIEVRLDKGEMIVHNNIIHSAEGAIIFTGAGSLEIHGNYEYHSGNFVAHNGTVIYAGQRHQKIASLPYNHLSLAHANTYSTLTTPTTVYGNLGILQASGLEIADSLRVMGNITIGENSKLVHNTTDPIIIEGNWMNTGVYEMNAGEVIFTGPHHQEISASGFNSVVIDKADGTVHLAGDILLNSDLNLKSGTLDLSTWSAGRSNPGGVLSMGPATMLIIGGTDNYPENFNTHHIDISSTIAYTGTIAQNIQNLEYGNLVLSNGGENPKSLISNIQVKGDVLINAGASFDMHTHTLNLFGHLTNDGTMLPSDGTLALRGTDKMLHGNISTYNLSILGSYGASGETVHAEGNLFIAPEGAFSLGDTDIFLSGDLTNRGILESNADATFNGTRLQTIQLENAVNSSSTGRIIFDGTVAPILNSTSSPQFATVHIKNTGGIKASVPWNVAIALIIHPGASFDGGAHIHTFNGHLHNYGTITSSGTLHFAPIYFPSTLQLDNGTTFSSTGRVVFGGIQAITIEGSNAEFQNVSITNTHTDGVSPQTSWTLHGNLLVETGALFNAGSNFNHTLHGSITNNGSLMGQSSTFHFAGNPSSVEGSGKTHFSNLVIEETSDFFLRKTVNIEKDFMLNTTDFHTLGNGVIFSGNTASTINSSVGPITFDYLGINKTNDHTTELLVPAFVANDLVLEEGILHSSEGNLLTVVNEAYADPGTPTSYVDGPMSKKGNQAFVFPLGNDGVWARLGISAPLSENAEFRARYLASPHPDTINLQDPLYNISQVEHWILDRIAGEDNVNVTLYWEDHHRSGISDTDDLVVARYDGEKWVDHTNLGGVSETLAYGYVTSEAITSFSPFTLGSTSDANALPVEFLDFQAEYSEPMVLLQWVTASEINNDYFTIERSRNGIDFEAVNWVQGAGTSSRVLHYQDTDPDPYPGISYYRIKQTDFDGTYMYSAKAAVNVNNPHSQPWVNIYPNPARADQVRIDINQPGTGELNISIYNTMGTKVFSHDYHMDSNSHQIIHLPLSSSLSPGQYMIRLQGESWLETRPVLIY